MRPFVEELSTQVLSLEEREKRIFSPPLHWVSLSNGDADFHDNVIFFGFEQKQAEPVLVAKIPRLAENGWMLKTEYDHLVELWHCIGAKAANYIPKPYALSTIQDRPVLMISYVSGESMTRLSRQAFWGKKDQVSALAREAAQALRELNRLTETPVRGDETLHVDFRKKADKFRELFPITSEEERALSELLNIVEERSRRASHKVIIQGDFWHGNMIRNKQLGTLMFIDWQFARWSVDVSLDVYFFLLAGALSASETAIVNESASQAFQLLSSWRSDVIPQYLTAYGNPDDYVLLPQKHGMLLCCVEKAVRSALDFGYSHPDDLMWRHLFGELLHWPAEG